MKSSSLLGRTLSGEAAKANNPHLPIWMMRQAGRYQTTYRALKEKHSFLELCRSPELALQVTMLPIEQFDMDAAIVFADILLPLEALGVQIDFTPGPHIHNPITAPEQVNSLKLGNCDAFMVVPDVLKTLCKTLHAGESPKGVLGFAGAPWTLACYLIKHGPYKGFQGVPVFAEIYPDKFSELLEKLTTVTIKYLLAQAESGADALQLFDTWAGMLNVEAYRRHCLPYTARIVEAVQKTGTPVIVYVNGSSHLLEAIEESGCAGISVDWRTCLLDAHRRLKPETVLQGNLDPCVLFSSRDNIIETVTRMLGDGSQHERYIANLGHGILQETPEDNAALIIDTVKAFRKDVTQ